LTAASSQPERRRPSVSWSGAGSPTQRPPSHLALRCWRSGRQQRLRAPRSRLQPRRYRQFPRALAGDHARGAQHGAARSGRDSGEGSRHSSRRAGLPRPLRRAAGRWPAPFAAGSADRRSRGWTRRRGPRCRESRTPSRTDHAAARSRQSTPKPLQAETDPSNLAHRPFLKGARLFGASCAWAARLYACRTALTSWMRLPLARREMQGGSDQNPRGDGPLLRCHAKSRRRKNSQDA